MKTRRTKGTGEKYSGTVCKSAGAKSRRKKRVRASCHVTEGLNADVDGADNEHETDSNPGAIAKQQKKRVREIESVAELDGADAESRNGEAPREADGCAAIPDVDGGADVHVETDKVYGPVIQRLRELQKERAFLTKSIIRQSNCLRMTVAGALGYQTSMTESERKKKIAEADALIESPLPDRFAAPIRASKESISCLESQLVIIDGEAAAEAERLPVSSWCFESEQRGFKLGSLATIIGEAGDLSQFANPGKLWKYMGCAPFESHGKNLSCATWRRGTEGKLKAEQWADEVHYSPRRHAIMYVIGNNLQMGNGDGPYRRRYEDSKKRFQERHPDYKKARCHYHAITMTAKLLLKNLWIEWRARDDSKSNQRVRA